MNKQNTYSKKIPIVTGAIFIVCILFSFIMPITGCAYDTSYYVTIIGVTGSVFAISIVFYSKKAQAENTAKLKTELYKISVQEQLRYNKEMMKLKKEYEMTDEDVADITNESSINDMRTEALQSATDTINEDLSSATSEITYEALG